MAPPSLVIIGARPEDEGPLREQIGDLVEISGVETDPEKGMELIRRQSPTIALLYLDHDPDTILAVSGDSLKVNGCAPLVVSRDRDPERILQAMRAGARDFAFLEEGREDVRRAILNLSMSKKTGTPGPAEGGTVISVFACKGGSGATTVATNLAGALLTHSVADGGRGGVVLLDIDFMMGDVLVFLDLASRYTWGDLVDNLHRLDDELLRRSLTTHKSGLFVVAQSDAVEAAEDLDASGVAKALAFLKRHFDYIVIDGLRDFRETSLLALDASDTILLTMTQDIPALKNANRCLNIFRRLGYKSDKVRLVLNRFQRRGQIDAESIADALGIPVGGMVANDFPTVIKAVNEGTMLVDSAPRAKVSRDIVSLVTLAAGAETAPRRGRFKLWG